MDVAKHLDINDKSDWVVTLVSCCESGREVVLVSGCESGRGVGSGLVSLSTLVVLVCYVGIICTHSYSFLQM